MSTAAGTGEVWQPPAAILGRMGEMLEYTFFSIQKTEKDISKWA